MRALCVEDAAAARGERRGVTRRLALRAPPPLDILDKLVKPPEGGGKYAKYGLSDTCADGYSDKHFFLKRWLDEEERKLLALKAERKARRAERARREDDVAAQKRERQQAAQQRRRMGWRRAPQDHSRPTFL